MTIPAHTHTFTLPTVPDWDDAGWVTATAYTEGVALLHNGSSYQVKEGKGHTSGASTEPGVGGDWQTYWRKIAGQGEAGAPGARFSFSTTTTMADPGAGVVRYNNATPASATALAIDDQTADSGNPDISAFLLTWDDSTNPTVKGTVHVCEVAAPENFHIFNVTGITDNSGWVEVAVSYVAGSGTFSNADSLAVTFNRAGDKGSDGAGIGDFLADGSVPMTGNFDGGGNNITNVGTVDGRDVSADGTKLDYLTVTGAVDLDANNTKLAGIEASADVTDTANVTAAGALMDSELTNIAAVKALDQGVATTDGPQFATLELGHASDTTISRSAAGEAAVEGKRVLNTGDLSKQTIFIPAASMLAATTNGPASADIEATTNAQNYTVLDFDASTDEYAHFQIAMPKGWNEGTITFQVFWSTTATDTDGVAWGLQGVAVSDGDTVDASWGTAVVVTDDAQSAAGDVLVTAESSAVTIAGTPAAGDLCFFRLFRDVSDANDDMTEDARLVGVKLLYTIDALKDD